jgi:hypothetical protein
LAEIARRFVLPPEKSVPRSVNLLGLTPLDFAAPGSVESLRSMVEEQGWQTLSCWAMGDDLDTLAHAGQAQVNLVVSAVGLPAAKVLRERFGTPWVVGAPVGPFVPGVFAALDHAARTGECSAPILEREQGALERTVTLVGEPVTMGSLAGALAKSWGCKTRVLCPLEGLESLLSPADEAVSGEEGAETALRGAEIVVGDPLYRHICPKEAEFHELPHWALSGRCYQKGLKNLFSGYPLK